MKKILWVVSLICFGLFLMSQESKSPKSKIPSIKQEVYDEVVAHFISANEKTARDAVWTSKNTFKVGVVNDGSSRDGYASYVCGVLYDYGFKGRDVYVYVIDAALMARSGEFKTLGKSRCL